MPFDLSTQSGVLHVSFTGVVTDSDLRNLMVAMEEFERGCIVFPDRITDLSNTTRLELTFADLWALAERRKAHSIPNLIKSAIVAPQPVQIGFARMFQTLNDHPKITIAIFASQEAAAAWICSTDRKTISESRDSGERLNG